MNSYRSGIRSFARRGGVALALVLASLRPKRPDTGNAPHYAADLDDWEDECGRLTASEVQTSLARSPGAVESIR